MTAERRGLRRIPVVPAGGVGVRAGLGMPKQLARIAGKPIIEHTLAAIDSSSDIDEIIVMMEPGSIAYAEELVASGRFSKLRAAFEGGATRNDSTRLALAHIGDAEAKVLLHDAVRPFVDHRILGACVDALDEYGAVDTAIPSADTIVEVDENRLIVDVPPRARLRRGQTPQAFLLSVIRTAYEKAALDADFAATDDCTVVLRYTPEVPIVVVEGSDENMKITEPIDVFIADKLFQLTSSEPPGVDPAARERALDGKVLVAFGGSEGIGAAIAEAAERFGATVLSYSRSTTGTHVERRGDVAEALRDAEARGGRIDYVVNTAGLLSVGALSEQSEDDVRELVDVNLLGPIALAQEAYPYLERSHGQLLLFTSSSYTRGRAGYGVYSATKAAVVNLTQSLAEEWADAGIRVNCINPQRTRTPMRERAFGEEPPETLLTPEQVALSALDVLIGETTGQVIDVRRTG